MANRTLHDTSAVSAARIHWLLRIGAGLCFIGHGAFGIIGKEAWLPYFGAVGIGADYGWRLEPLVGTVDIVFGFLVIVRPRRFYLIYMVVWAAWTALLRPLAGEPFWEAIERAGNYGVPFALLLGFTGGAGWFSRVTLQPVGGRRWMLMRRALIATTSLLLLGHGMLALSSKPALLRQYGAVFGSGGAGVIATGVVDVILAIAIVARPIAPLAIFIALWKLATESLFYFAGSPFWEVVERAGSYAAPLALAFWVSYARMNAAEEESGPESD